MLVLRAIGRFFKKIWDWIKQTAWIQPLLIVGIIFGIIFSIRPIIDGVKAANAKRGSAEVYYLQYQLSLNGGENSEADKLTKAIDSENPVEELKKAGINETKFFLTFVDKNTTSCKDAFQYLETKLGTKEYESKDNKAFKLFTIFVDESTTTTTSDNKTAFQEYLDRNLSFFENAVGRAYESDLYSDGGVNTKLDELAKAEKVDTPTIMLIDVQPNEEVYDYATYLKPGVNEIIFNVEGTDAISQAEYLTHCWNHTDEFNVNKIK